MKWPTSSWIVLLLAGLTLSGNVSALTFTVNSIFDTGDTNPGDGICEATSGGIQCTLRAAIEEANARAGVDTIVFSLGLIAISISGTPLPTIVGVLTIDGTTAPNYAAAQTSVINAPPSIYIVGTNLTGTTADGFRIANGVGATIKGIGIIGFPDNGIELFNTNNVVLDSNWIGIGRTGGKDGNDGSGIYLSGSENINVGQTINQAGPSLVGRGNLISNNLEDGVFVLTGADIVIAGNYIGFDPFNDTDYGNGGHGLHLQGPNVRVGNGIGYLVNNVANFLKVPNVITNNDGSGIRTITGGHTIRMNQIYRNGSNGIVLNGGSTQVGFTQAQQGNSIFSNTGHGVVIGSTFASSSNLVEGNTISLNTQRGVQISLGSSNVVSKNQIFDNLNDGVRVDAASNTVGSNTIGFSNGVLKGNGFNGIVVNSSSNTVSSNSIFGVDDDGIDVITGNANQITGNDIGIGSAGQDYGNVANGVRVRAAATNTLISGNRIGNQNQNGVLLEGGGSRLCDNRIGMGASFQVAGNTLDGIRVTGSGNRIGTIALGCAANLIGNNGSNGVQIESAANIVRDNFIGRQDLTFFGNGSDGILLLNSASLSEIMGNVLGRNDGDAIRLATTAGTRNRIQENIFHMNGTDTNDLAIDIAADGVTANDANDPDAGPNNVQNTPELLVVLMSPNQLEITYRMTSSISNSTYPITVDFYRGANRFLAPDVSKVEEGVFVFRDVYNLAPNTSKVVQFDPQSALGTGRILAMATDAEGNSSEFSFAVPFDVRDLPELIFKNGFETP